MSSLGAWGESQLRGAAKGAIAGFFGNPYVRDYHHASKTFLPNGYQNAPKLKFLFHTVFEINQDIVNLDNGNGTPNINLSVLVKSVKLPSFTIETQQLNQYNRKRINQTKIKYDPIDITFHDDSGNVVSSLWYRYYTYYYQDGRNPQVVFNGKKNNSPNTQPGTGASAADYTSRTQYQNSTTGFQNWGYNGAGAPQSSDPLKKAPFFNNITVFGINNHQWISYTLINPVITRFGHDTYDYAEAAGVMSHTMTLDYETVVYNQGGLDGTNPGNILKGFGDITTYDRTTSPIMVPGANATLLGQGGLINAAGGFVNDLSNGNILSAIRTAGVTYNTVKNINPTTFLTSSILQAVNQTLNSTNDPKRNTSWEIPVYQQSGQQNTTGSPTAGITAPTSYSQIGSALSGLGSQVSNTFNNVFGQGTTAGVQTPDPNTGNYVP